jgi:xanthine/CO dehydrogenase XdhC/CoxF family maturation factor
LQNEGIPAHLFDRVHAPVGLDIGAITPEEIAVAITAELIAVRRHATATLPYLSWFKGARESGNEDRGEDTLTHSTEGALEEDDHKV